MTTRLMFHEKDSISMSTPLGRILKNEKLKPK